MGWRMVEENVWGDGREVCGWWKKKLVMGEGIRIRGGRC